MGEVAVKGDQVRERHGHTGPTSLHQPAKRRLNGLVSVLAVYKAIALEML